MAHPHEQLIRAVYTEFGKGNLDGVLALCSPDIQFHFRGDNVLAGDYDGAGLAQIAMKLGQIAGPSLQMNIEDVLADDTRGVVFLRDTLTRQDSGESYELRLLHVYRIENGKLTSFDELPFDQGAFDEAFRALGVPSITGPEEPVHSIH
ncbi:nuclear transport factor 2 family protein [Archangium lansingense]|uniref:Nuclear transport factor 2 family protein n=1 Tax=Archangium lansingense TaxID=2995310 RepID=A0ABT3ZXU5_9BACT|nr:nuclear transport factor 2 family protein [Archangium lansinium]MCY1074126.1 nuclear transport factor 2 family protein [Archangium lansinium]